MFKKIIYTIFCIVFTFILVITINSKYRHLDKIDKILKSNSYSYLSEPAKSYVKEVYEKTGTIILTEKNKKDNEPYLNPKFVSYLSLTDEEKNKINLIPNTYVLDFALNDSYKETTYPETYNLSNLNNKSYITPMKNQGDLDLCWSFASIEQVESYLMVKNNIPYNSSSETFSIRQMDYATSNNGIKNFKNENGYRDLTTTGNFYISSIIMSNGLSLVSDSLMPFDSDKSRKNLVDILNYGNSNYELNSSIMMPTLSKDSSDEEKKAFNNIVKENIINYGGAYVGTGSPTGSCGFKNIDNTYTIVDIDNCISSSGHAMQIIGWDDNYNYTYCRLKSENQSVNDSGLCSNGTLTNGKGAWILRNSWGDDTDKKFVYLAYDSYDVDINFTTSLTNSNERKWDNNYHKKIGPGGTINKNSDTLIFNKKINTTEKIQMIKFLSTSINGEYSVSINTNGNSYSNVKNVKIEYPGIYTIDLSDDDIILDSSKFSITIQSTNNAYLLENSISVFTSNLENTPQIITDDLDGTTIKLDSDSNYEFNVYSSSKNIPSNKTVTYSLLMNNIDYSDKIISVSNNKVAANNIFSTLKLDGNIKKGTYTLRITYNNKYFDSILIIPSLISLEGDGTENNPYLIYTEDDLYQMRFDLDGYYLLKNDITLSNEWIPIGTSNSPFTGGFDGNNHIIKGLTINQSSENAVGFFGYFDSKYDYTLFDQDKFQYVDHKETSYIKNITFENPIVSNEGNAGILIGNLTFNSSNFPDNSINIGSPKMTIENVHFIKGHVTSNTGDSGVIAANLDITPYRNTTPYIYINNVFSSTTITGYYSAGLIGFINDSYQSGERAMLDFILQNFQNVGLIDQSNFKKQYSKNDKYSPVIGGIYGNLSITLENFIINSTFDNLRNMGLFAEEHETMYFIGSYDKETSNNFKYKVTNGYYSSTFFISSTDIKNTDFSKWKDFDKYWKIEEIEGIKRLPVLKTIDFKYKELPDEINLKLYEDCSLLKYINEANNHYITYSILENNKIIKIDDVDNNNDYYTDDIILTGIQKGNATLKVINNYDGIEKNIIINVIADKTDKPIITFYSNNTNNNNYSQQVNALEPFNLTKNKFVNDGYVFEGWNTLSDGSGTLYNDEDFFEFGIDENLKLYAQWSIEKFTLVFDANGGTGTMSNLTNISKKDFYIPSNKYTKDNYKFISWNTKSDGTGTSFNNNALVKASQITTNNGIMTLYAQWQKIKNRIIFDANNGKGIMNDLEIEAGKSQALTLNTFTKSDYIFTGWNTMPDGSGTSYSDGQIIEIDNDIILYAQWKKINGIISFNPNTGTGVMNDQNFKLNTQFRLNKNLFIKNGYLFKNWNTKSDGTGISYNDEQLVTFDKDVTLYAIWEASIAYTINKYSVDDINCYISKIMVNTELNSFKSNITLSSGYEVSVDYKIINNKQLLYTGGKTYILYNNNPYKEYTNIVIGDINGDGEINSADLLRIRQHLLGTNILSGAYYISSDINYDNSINSADLLRIRQHLLGIKPIE